MEKLKYLSLLALLSGSAQAIIFENITDADVDLKATYCPAPDTKVTKKLTLEPNSTKNISISDFLLKREVDPGIVSATFCVTSNGLGIYEYGDKGPANTVQNYPYSCTTYGQHTEDCGTFRFKLHNKIKFNPLKPSSFDKLDDTKIQFGMGSIYSTPPLSKTLYEYSEELACKIVTQLLVDEEVENVVTRTFFNKRNEIIEH